MTTAIETYLNSLPENVLTIDISCRGLTSFPDLTRFKNLKILNCSVNQLTYLPTLPQNLKILYCSNNQLTSLPTLPQNLTELNCYNNKLTSLPTLPQNLKILYCSNNQLTSLPTLPQNLDYLDCSYNKLTVLPTLPQNLETLHCYNNPISEIVNNSSFIKIKQNIQTLNNFRHLYYCLQFKEQLRKWLWEKVRESKIKKLYNPIYLLENLGEEDELDAVLDNWK
jgi:Leucine-rich repeat (LRR) protein